MALELLASVGSGGINRKSDVVAVQKSLNFFWSDFDLVEDGLIGPKTIQAINEFQVKYVGIHADGLISPHGPTIKVLQSASRMAKNHHWYSETNNVLCLPDCCQGSKTFTDAMFELAAFELECETEAIKAVTAVESCGCGFRDNDSKPTILFEAHQFSRLTEHAFDHSHPTISSRKWNRSLYNLGGDQYDKLALAASLDREAALKACSWGAFQIMGFNWFSCGFNCVDSMIESMFKDADEHLRAFVCFIQCHDLTDTIQEKNWAEFARRYNGPGYKKNRYDEKIEREYLRLKLESQG